ncbi:class I SAM-dependent methyltransferase [Lentisalinibacter sediminis]|uniref:class I SAM-dependent methyltransferase n=1 Tax=Lentisalinibacter sediminis TaxID=2992237 RepID=UPI00386EAE1C
MKRETSNRIRFVLEELVPPILRDSAFMRWLFERYWGAKVAELEHFRRRIHRLTEADYEAVYVNLPRLHLDTDNSRACLERITAELLPGRIVDIGCGAGGLLRHLIDNVPADAYQHTGVDIVVPGDLERVLPGVTLVEGAVERLPFEDRSFDTVICTHVLEHVVDIRTAVAELRRICRRRLIIVVPKEREYRFTFNPHLHFFPYEHSFLRQIMPVPENAICERVGRDFFYREDREG